MIEIQWGAPVALRRPHDVEIEKFSTIEKARYWLYRKWPTADTAQRDALAEIEAAMDCLKPVESARTAFIAAALSAGFLPAVAS